MTVRVNVMTLVRPATQLLADDTGNWRERAACAGRNPEEFFGPDHQTAQEKRRRQAAAIAVCETCPVAKECLTNALEAEGDASVQHRFGVFGGMTPNQRAALARGETPRKLGTHRASATRAETMIAKRAQDTRPRPADCAEPSAGREVMHRRRGELPCWACVDARLATARARRQARATEDGAA